MGFLHVATPSVEVMSSTSALARPSRGSHRDLPFLIAGAAYTIGGGLLAAATAYVTTQKTAWATAYIVLIGGVVQIALGAALAHLAPRAAATTDWIILALFNLGNAGVLAGQLGGVVLLTDLGTLSLAVSLALALVATWRGSDAGGPTHPGWLWGFRVLLAFLAVSMVTGVVLAHLGL